ncbi:MAG: aminotransferase class III-fold pyridoxal phosphate-dependent enzyme [Acidobacteriota bacterium]|nr:MAG: aminotransferase class III-fold pyridoxal phosphate-dependent enzyme [Acidobacteriota bacterium]
MSRQKSHLQKAREVLPGGVNSSTRFNRALNSPFYVARGRGSRVWDLDGNEYIDMSCAHGAGLLGNAHPLIDDALLLASKLGYVNSLETEYHEELARKVCSLIPCAERVRFCSAGSEATLHLIRACRAFTRRDKIIRIEGHFHGYHELIYIGGHPPQSEFPGNRESPFIESPGIPQVFADLIIPVPFNDREALEQVIRQHGDEAAVLILEPVNFNCACIKPEPGYLEFVRKITEEKGILLFFDEIQSSFKKNPGGAQEDFGIVPDVCTIGKALGGGLPLSAFCGKAEIMDIYQPVGPVQHSGTFNAHLVPVLTGLAFLNEISKPYFYATLSALESQFHRGMDGMIQDLDLNVVVPHYGSRFNILLGRKTPAVKYEDTFCHQNQLFLKVLRACWEKGAYFHDYGGGPLHHGYSIQHSAEDVDEVLNILEDVFREFREELVIQ